MPVSRRRFLTGFLSATVFGCGLASGGPANSTDGLKFRVAIDGWGHAKPAEVEAVLRSTAGTLWPYFARRAVEPIVVLRGHEGPIVHYQRNVIGEIVVKLDSSDRYWGQYAYQFAHEFCHILCGFDEDWKGNNWFEETLCETASLFALRRLAVDWDGNPPFAVWKSFAPTFREYATEVMDGRTQVGSTHLGDFYRKHRGELEKNPCDRVLNGAMAVVLLGLMEGSPVSWEAVTWLNSSPSPPGETFSAYLAKWHAAVPARHRLFVEEIIRRFDLPMPAFTPATVGAKGNSPD